MTVAQLRAALDALPAGADGWTVVLSRDSEGNAFSPLRDCNMGVYGAHPAGPWWGDFVDVDVDAPPPGPTTQTWGPRALCLWPVR